MPEAAEEAVEPADGNHLGKRGQPPRMIRMIVAEHEVIDLFEAGLLGRAVDSFGVAIAYRPSGVDQ